MQQLLLVVSRLEQVEFFDRRRTMQMLEADLEGADLSLLHTQICAELVEHLLDGFQENGAIGAFLQELDLRSKAHRPIEPRAHIDPPPESSIDIVQVRHADTSRKPVARQADTFSDGAHTEIPQQLLHGLRPTGDRKR